MALYTYVGGAESNSFATLVEADAYLADLPDDTEDWENLSDEAKELRLELAAELMGHMPLKGLTVFRNQRLCFPRTCQPYERRFQIPADVKKVQSFIAYSVVHRMLEKRPEVSAEGIDPSLGKPSSISLAGLISVSFSTADGVRGNILEAMLRAIPFPAYMLMKPYTSQFRGRSVPPVDEDRTLSTTTSA